jgi:Skp family chaperone for outer membrane proteins
MMRTLAAHAAQLCRICSHHAIVPTRHTCARTREPAPRTMQTEAVALLQQRLRYEERLSALQDELAALQQRLKDSTDRASKMRQHADKCAAGRAASAVDTPRVCGLRGTARPHAQQPNTHAACIPCRGQRSAAQQLEKLKLALAQAGQQQADAVASEQASHAAQLQAMRDELQQRVQEWVRGWGSLVVAVARATYVVARSCARAPLPAAPPRCLLRRRRKRRS